MNKKIRIAISGSTGRMGKILIQEIQKNKNVLLTVALVRKNHACMYQDTREILGINKTGILIIDQLNEKTNNFDVLIDFTSPKNTLKNLEYCKKQKKHIVIGTTGFSQEEKNIIQEYSKTIAIVYSSNFSIGMNLLFKLVEKTAKTIGHDFDIDIIECHHRNKIDAPSGTALTIGEHIAKTMHWDFEKHAMYYKKGISGIRKKNQIGFSFIRSGNHIGKHSVVFSHSGEEIKITHNAFNRISFAQGAIKSALWMHQKTCGLFNMNDILLF